jgi:hypothetical protein
MNPLLAETHLDQTCRAALCSVASCFGFWVVNFSGVLIGVSTQLAASIFQLQLSTFNVQMGTVCNYRHMGVYIRECPVL